MSLSNHTQFINLNYKILKSIPQQISIPTQYNIVNPSTNSLDLINLETSLYLLKQLEYFSIIKLLKNNQSVISLVYLNIQEKYSDLINLETSLYLLKQLEYFSIIKLLKNNQSVISLVYPNIQEKYYDVFLSYKIIYTAPSVISLVYLNRQEKYYDVFLSYKIIYTAPTKIINVVFEIVKELSPNTNEKYLTVGVTFQSWNQDDYYNNTYWKVNDQVDAKALINVDITDTLHYEGQSSLVLTLQQDHLRSTYIEGERVYTHRSGEQYIDLRYMGVYEGSGTIPSIYDGQLKTGIDLSGMTVKFNIYCPYSSGGLTQYSENGIQFFIKSVDLTTGTEVYGNYYCDWKKIHFTPKPEWEEEYYGNIQEGVWSEVTIEIPTINGDQLSYIPVQGSCDEQFNPEKIAIIGIKYSLPDNTISGYNGDIYVDNLQIYSDQHDKDIIFNFNTNELPENILKYNGFNTVQILQTEYMDSITSTNIYNLQGKTHTDEELIHILNKCKIAGHNVALKPHVDIITGEQRGLIEFSSEIDKQLWFNNYSNFINHYATMQEQNNVELLIIGTELEKLTGIENLQYWEDIISQIRQIYSGKIIYGQNWDNYDTEQVCFWHLVDYVGIDAYFPTSDSQDPDFIELKAGWTSFIYECGADDGPVEHNWLQELNQFQQTVNKSIIFTEFGHRSMDYQAKQPWEYQVIEPVNLNLQRLCYNQLFETFANKPWFLGFIVWYVNPKKDDGGMYDTNFTVLNKDAIQQFNIYEYLDTILYSNYNINYYYLILKQNSIQDLHTIYNLYKYNVDDYITIPTIFNIYKKIEIQDYSYIISLLYNNTSNIFDLEYRLTDQDSQIQNYNLNYYKYQYNTQQIDTILSLNPTIIKEIDIHGQIKQTLYKLIDLYYDLYATFSKITHHKLYKLCYILEVERSQGIDLQDKNIYDLQNTKYNIPLIINSYELFELILSSYYNEGLLISGPTFDGQIIPRNIQLNVGNIYSNNILEFHIDKYNTPILQQSTVSDIYQRFYSDVQKKDTYWYENTQKLDKYIYKCTIEEKNYGINVKILDDINNRVQFRTNYYNTSAINSGVTFKINTVFTNSVNSNYRNNFDGLLCNISINYTLNKSNIDVSYKLRTYLKRRKFLDINLNNTELLQIDGRYLDDESISDIYNIIDQNQFNVDDSNIIKYIPSHNQDVLKQIDEFSYMYNFGIDNLFSESFVIDGGLFDIYQKDTNIYRDNSYRLFYILHKFNNLGQLKYIIVVRIKFNDCETILLNFNRLLSTIYLKQLYLDQDIGLQQFKDNLCECDGNNIDIIVEEIDNSKVFANNQYPIKIGGDILQLEDYNQIYILDSDGERFQHGNIIYDNLVIRTQVITKSTLSPQNRNTVFHNNSFEQKFLNYRNNNYDSFNCWIQQGED